MHEKRVLNGVILKGVLDNLTARIYRIIGISAVTLAPCCIIWAAPFWCGGFERRRTLQIWERKHKSVVRSVCVASGVILGRIRCEAKVAPRPLLRLDHALHALSSIHKSILVVDAGHATADDSLLSVRLLLAFVIIAALTSFHGIPFLVNTRVNGKLHRWIRIVHDAGGRVLELRVINIWVNNQWHRSDAIHRRASYRPHLLILSRDSFFRRYGWFWNYS